MADKYQYSTIQTPVAVFNTKIVQYNVNLSTNQTPFAVIDAYLVNTHIVLSTENTPTGSIEVTDGVNYTVEIGQYINGSFTKLGSKAIRVPMNPRDVATVAVITDDDGTNVKVTVRFFDRKTGNKWEISFTISELVNVSGGIGLYTEDQTEVDNVTIMYNKS